MGRPRASTIETATPDRILAAAEAAFAEHGLARATLADIGGRAGISRPSLLYHFATKEALYAEVVRRTFARLTAVLAEAMAAPAPFEGRLERLVRAFSSFLRREPAHARIVVRELLEEEGPGGRIVEEQVVPLLETVVAFLAREGRGRLRPELDLRASVLTIASDVFLRNAAAALRAPVWGDPTDDQTWAVARIHMLEDR